MIIVEVRVAHPERSKDSLLREVVERLSGHALHDHREQREARVRVDPLVTRLEVECFLPGDDSEHIVFGYQVIVPPPGVSQQLPLIAQSAGVVHELANRDARFVVGKFRDVLVYIIVERESSVAGRSATENAANCFEFDATWKIDEGAIA